MGSTFPVLQESGLLCSVSNGVFFSDSSPFRSPRTEKCRTRTGISFLLIEVFFYLTEDRD